LYCFRFDTIKVGRSNEFNKSAFAVEDDEIVGFGDIDQTGYLDRLSVHMNHHGMGITLKNYVMEKKISIGFSNECSGGNVERDLI
jgi:putative acetyltransferase